MRISRLELHGFKSFPDRTSFTFGPGVSCVVGPNGSGKSNVVDALKWVIGEQSAKSLRGGEMLDVIFAGSSERSPVGFAEVTLGMTADRGEPFPGDYAALSDVQVTRRLHRNGTSEYLINTVRVRRRDIVELFLDTGIGNNLYSFIEQGQIDKMIHASPEERRGLIDEAAGISRYKARRDEAQDRLDATGGQLDRAADLADEMGRRLSQLEKQVWKAAQFRRLRALVRQQEIFLSVVKFAELVADRSAVRTGHRDAITEAEASDRDVDRREEELEERRSEAELADASAALRRDEVADLDARRRELEGAKTFQERRQGELGRQLEHAQLAATGADDDRARAAADQTAADRDAQAAAGMITGLDTDVAAGKATVRIAREERAKARHAVDAADRALATLEGERAAGQGRARGLDDRITAVPAVIERLDGQIRATGERIEALDTRLGLLASGIRDREALEADVAVRVAAARERVATARDAEAQATARVQAAEGALERIRAAADADVRAAETAAGGSRRTGEDGVRQAERLAASWAEALRSTESKQVQARTAAERAREADVDRRGRAWVDALERSWGERDKADAARHQAGISASEAEEAAAVRSAEEERAARVRAAEAAAATAGREQITAFEAERDVVAAEIDAATAILGEREGERARLRSEREALRGTIGALEARERDEAARVVGAAELARALQDPRPLSQRVAWTAEEEARLGPLVGDRLNLPVATTLAEVVAAARAVKGRVSLVYAPGGDPVDALLGRVAVVADLAAALAHHAAGGAAVVAGTGERVGVDGVVEIGPRTAVAAGVSTRRTLADARGRLAVVDERIAELEAEILAARATVDRAKPRIDAARESVRRAEREARAAVDAAGEGIRRSTATTLDLLRKEARDTRRRLLEDRDRALAASATRRTAEIEAARGTLRDALAAVRREAERALEAIRGDFAADLERAVADGRDAVGQLARAAEAAAREADSGVDALRLERRAGVEIGRAAVERERAELSTHRAATSDAQGAHARVEADASARETERKLLERDATAATGDRAGAAARLAELVEERAGVIRDRDRLAGERAAAALAVAEVDRRIVASRAAADAGRIALLAAEEAERAAADALREREIGLAKASERALSAAAATDAARKRRVEAEERLAAASAQVEELAASCTGAVTERDLAMEELGSVDQKRAELWDRFQRERDRVVALREAVRVAEEAVRAAVTRRDSAQRALGGLTGHVDRIQAEIDAVRRRIEERYQLSLAALLDRVHAGGVELAVDDSVRVGIEVGGRSVAGVEPGWIRPVDLDDERRVGDEVDALERYRGELSALGEVNLGAIAEYDELRGRFSDLVNQRTDLEESVASLRAAIAKMNKECRQRFRDAFDRVNENFQVAYPRLVGGGSARLALTDEEDLLEAGVDIFVQPPGKRLQNLSLLSGGEKAMTAIGLLIALFRVKPSPFCVLDEVDAPLDEANGTRFNDMLREMALTSQFVVITHNRKTMECADTLYGVTMARPGVSRLVSVEL